MQVVRCRAASAARSKLRWRRKYTPAIAATEPLLRADSPDAWLLAAAAVARLGREEDFLLFAERARAALAKAPFTAPHRRLRWQEIEGVIGNAPQGSTI